MLSECLLVLGQIENNDIDQNEGSIKVGKLLYDLFVDGNNTRLNKDLERDHKELEDKKKAEQIVLAKIPNISWAEFKTRKSTILYKLTL